MAAPTALQFGWDGRTRTCECQSQSLVPYRLATSHYLARAGDSVAHTVRRYREMGGPGDPAPTGDPGGRAPADGRVPSLQERARAGENLSIFELRLPRPVAPGKASFVWGE